LGSVLSTGRETERARWGERERRNRRQKRRGERGREEKRE